jgi:predicted polyphosphate/ATP-dependent NAD kinase
MLTPQLGHLVQAVKQSSGENEHEVQEDIAAYVIEKMQQDTLYFIGSGSSTMAIKHQLGVDGTLLGVDVYANGDLLLTDANEQQLLDIMAEYPEFQCRLILTIIGGQGMLFGRGNHQVCHKVIAKLGLKRTWVIASKTKLAQLSGRALGVDTGNHALNQNLAGYVQVITGYQQQSLYPVGKS